MSQDPGSRPARRTLLAGAATALAGPAAAAAPAEAARAALYAFLAAFEACDLPAMEAAFAADATCFDRVVLSPRPPPAIRLADFRRAPGMPPGMRAIAQALPKSTPGPPYQSLKPVDLQVVATAEMALCTFHLESPHALSRRTVVLAPRDGAWKILHIHASNVSDEV
ncbi:MAG: nuclear transport factor 2 family protein [Proteobacteria bacterium]|nr:nuclear transport factor 2 family protein [Pseudomonadota bacterium]